MYDKEVVMTKDVLLSVRISQRLSAKLERLAKLTGRTKSWLVDSILAERVDPETKFAQSIIEAEKEADRDGWIPHEQVVAEMRAKFLARQAKGRRRAAE
jgi:predicted transcriptional regulator